MNLKSIFSEYDVISSEYDLQVIGVGLVNYIKRRRRNGSKSLSIVLSIFKHVEKKYWNIVQEYYLLFSIDINNKSAFLIF